MYTLIEPKHYGHKAPATAAIYGLVDPRQPGVVRYVGSSKNVERRLYGHTHSMCGREKTPKTEWVRQLRVEGVKPAAVLLEHLPKGVTEELKQKLEQGYIDTLGCDLNVRLTPKGHANSKDSKTKSVRLEVEELRLTVEILRAEVKMLRQKLEVA